MEKKLYTRAIEKIVRHEKYIVWWISSITFCFSLMLLAKLVFRIYLPYTSWQGFMETIGLLGFFVAVFSAWLTWRNDKRQAERETVVRKDEQINARMDACEQAFMVHSNLFAHPGGAEEFNRIKNDIDALRQAIARLSAQVQQTDTEILLKRKLSIIEKTHKDYAERIQLLEQKTILPN